MAKRIDETNICPQCKADLTGEPIPSEYRQFYGNNTHFSRLIGIQYGYDNPYHVDGVSEWRCPDCGYREGRFSGRNLINFESEKPPHIA